MRSRLTSAAKRSLYASGALDAWHRHRNRDRLTVVTFHRVLARTDPRWSTSDPEYTLPEDVFAECLRFFTRHYRVVALPDVIAAERGGRPLPECPMLITFDDGWSDNEEYALPALRAARLPAVMFVVAGAVDRDQPFWQEQLIAAWRSGRIDGTRAARLWHQAGGRGDAGLDRAAPHQLEPMRRLIDRLAGLGSEVRARVLAGVTGVVDDGERHMISSSQLRALASERVAIGAHGFSHAPLTTVDAASELRAARARLRLGLGAAGMANALSFPHGRFDDSVIATAREVGFELLFTSIRELPSARDLPHLLGRVGFTTDTVTGPDGEFRPELLALHLFRTPHAA